MKTEEICIREVNENLRRVRMGDGELTRSLAQLNKVCGFKEKYNDAYDIWEEEKIKKEHAIRGKEYRQRPEVKIRELNRVRKYSNDPERKRIREAYRKEYSQRPEVIKRRREYWQSDKTKEWQKKYSRLPKVKAKRKLYLQRPEVIAMREKYNQRPEVKLKNRMRSQKPDVIARRKEYQQNPKVKARRKLYDQSPKVIARIKKYNERPEVKLRRSKNSKNYYKNKTKKERENKK